MRGLINYVVCVLMILGVYMHNSVMGADNERATLEKIRNSHGPLIKYGQAN